MIDARTALKNLLETLEYTDREGDTQHPYVYFEEETDAANKARWPTPAFLIRGQSSTPLPADVGWGNWHTVTHVTVSLYVKQRASGYDSAAVLQELTDAVEAAAIANKSGVGGADYLLLRGVDDRDWLERPGVLRRDFEFELYEESWW